MWTWTCCKDARSFSHVTHISLFNYNLKHKNSYYSFHPLLGYTTVTTTLETFSKIAEPRQLAENNPSVVSCSSPVGVDIAHLNSLSWLWSILHTNRRWINSMLFLEHLLNLSIDWFIYRTLPLPIYRTFLARQKRSAVSSSVRSVNRSTCLQGATSTSANFSNLFHQGLTFMEWNHEAPRYNFIPNNPYVPTTHSISIRDSLVITAPPPLNSPFILFSHPSPITLAMTH